VLCHSGSQPGYKAHIALLPEPDIAVAVLSNRESTQPTRLVREIVATLLGGRFPKPDPAEDAVDRLRRPGLPPGVEQRLAGTYVDRDTGEWLRLAFKDSVLEAETLGDPLFLYHEGGGVFQDGEDFRGTRRARLGFAFDGEAPPVCRLDLSGRLGRLVKETPPRYGRSELAGFGGIYESDELGSRHRVSIGADGLAIEYGLGLDQGRVFPMTAIAPDLFLVEPRAPGIAYRHVFRFERDARGRVAGARVTMDRLSGVSLERRS
jgi:hypothetical protein